MTSATLESAKKPGGARVHVQRFGTFLSNMVMPNIPAFIAWGLITALFIATGWLQNTHWAISPILGGFGDQAKIGWQGAATVLAQAIYREGREERCGGCESDGRQTGDRKGR